MKRILTYATAVATMLCIAGCSHKEPIVQEMIPGISLQDFTIEREEDIKTDVTGVIEDPETFLTGFSIQVKSPDDARTLAISSGAEPDSQVMLIDKYNNFERLLFCGTPCSWNTGDWIDNYRFYVLGSEEYENGLRAPVIHLFNLQSETHITYYGPTIQNDL